MFQCFGLQISLAEKATEGSKGGFQTYTSVYEVTSHRGQFPNISKSLRNKAQIGRGSLHSTILQQMVSL